MKNLLVYVNPTKRFSKESEILTKVQIDNSLELGWVHEDILLVTNFDYKYNNVKSFVISDDNYCQHRPTCTKINAIVTLFKQGVVKNDTYWFHDFDAFQLTSDIDPNLGRASIGLTAYDQRPLAPQYTGAHRWNTGVIYFNKESKDIFEPIRHLMYERKISDEHALVKIEVSENEKGPSSLDKIKILNVSYNFIITPGLDLEECYEAADKPLKIIHFKPFDGRRLDGGINRFDFMLGKNKMNKVLLSETLIRLFKQYSIC